MNNQAARAILAKHSKSFALAGRLLSPYHRDDAAVLYAWCRRADDVIDTASPLSGHDRLAQLRSELASIYDGEPQRDDTLGAFQHLVRRLDIPRNYPEALLDGFAMDMGVVRFKTSDELLLYAYRVAGVVGLMMCIVLGAKGQVAQRHAVHLGMAMQLTNICRDVLEDWERQRLYIPDAILAPVGLAELGTHLGSAIPDSARLPLRLAVKEVLRLADEYYNSGNRGLEYLPPRAAVAIRAASKIYSAIGTQLQHNNYDALQGRVIVPRSEKVLFVILAVVIEAATRLGRSALSIAPRVPVVRSFAHRISMADVVEERLFHAI